MYLNVRKDIFLLFIFFMGCVWAPLLPAGQEVAFADEKLEELVRHEARRPEPGPIYAEDVLRLEELDAEGVGIQSLEGIQALQNLRELNLRNNDIECIKPLAVLTKLEDLTVRNNNIEDISPLEDLTFLNRLTFRENKVECIEALRNLTLLDDLSMHSNEVKDITPLQDLTLLEELTLRNNRIEDISVLAGLPNLKNVNLRDNYISDFSPLSGLENIRGEDSRLNVGGNLTTDFWAVEHYYEEIEDVDFEILLPVEERETQVVINEFMASNGRAVPDEDGEFPPWLELYNAGEEPVDLTDWYLSDDADNHTRWQFPDVSKTDHPEAAIIEPGEYKVVFTNTGRDRPRLSGEEEIDLEEGLAGHWKLDGDAQDSSGNDLHGEMHNVEPATDRAGNEEGALRVTGEDSFLDFPVGEGFRPDEEYFTLAFWVKPENISQETVIASFGLQVEERKGQVGLYQQGPDQTRKCQWGFGIERSGISRTDEMAVKEWTHIAVRWIDDTAQLYMNGCLIQEKEYDGYTFPGNLLVGSADYENSEFPFIGQVDGLRFYERALSEEELHVLAFSEEFHTNFRISRDGEPVILSNSDGDVVDYVPAIVLGRNEAYARVEDGKERWARFGGMNDLNFAGTTPGFTNTESARTISPPSFSRKAGFFEEDFDLELFHPDDEVKILYTLDGSEPSLQNLEGGESYEINYFYPESWFRSENKSRKNTTYVYEQPLEVTNRSGEENDLSEIITTYRGIEHSYHGWEPPAEKVFKGKVVRARAYRETEEAWSKSEVQSATFFVHPQGEDRYSFPVLSLVTDTEKLFGYDRGIYVPGEKYFAGGGSEHSYPGRYHANFAQRGRAWDRRVSMEVFEKNGKRSFSQNTGMRIHGGLGRTIRQKAFRLYARDDYDEHDNMKYSFFPGATELGTEEPLEKFRRILFRQGGDRYEYINDVVAHEIMKHSKVGTQRTRRFIHFINGEYWGMINARDRLDEYHLAYNYNTDPENVIILDSPTRELSPDTEDLEAGKPEDVAFYNDFHRFALEKDLSKKDNYRQIKEMLCVDSYIDYYVSFIYLINIDWFGRRHFRFWRVRETSDKPYHDGKWRLLVWDFDESTFRPFSLDLLENAMHPEGGGEDWAFGRPYLTELFRNMLESDVFRYRFINRFADHMNTTLQPSRIKSTVEDEYRPLAGEINEHVRRWGQSVIRHSPLNRWQDLADERPSYQRQQIIDNFNEFYNEGIEGEAEVTLNVNAADKGYIRLNTIDIHPDTVGIENEVYPWSGIYFQGVPVEVEAVAYPGYRLKQWEGIDSEESEVTLELEEDREIKAIFEENTDDPKVEVPDDHLRYEIYQMLDKDMDEPLLQSDMKELTELDVRDYAIRDLEGLQYAANLEELNIRDNGLTDAYFEEMNLELLADMEHLWYLNIRGNELTYLGETSPIRKLTRLEFLSMRDNDIEDISALAYLENLQNLNVRNNNISDLSPLAELEHLTERLYVEGNPLQRSDYYPIEHYVMDIKYVDFTLEPPPTGKVVAFPDQALEEEVREALNKPQGDLYQGELESIAALDLSDRTVRSLEGLHYAANLQELSLQANDLGDEELAELKLSVLSGLSRLRRLDLSENRISDLSPLQELPQLEELILKGNDIKDLTPLWHVASLRGIDLRDNRVEDAAPLRLQASLQGEGSYLYLAGNEKLWDYTPLLPRYFYIEEVDFQVLDPAPHTLKEEDYRFEYWSPYNAGGSYPENMLFLQSEQDDPKLEDEPTMPYYVYADQYHADDEDKEGYPYHLTGRTRINGLREQGVSFINTGRGRDLGAAVLALDTSGMENIEVSWKGGTVTPNSRVYYMRLQYRVGREGEFQDVKDELGNVVEYRRSAQAGHTEMMEPVQLPEEAEKEPYIQLRWKYYYTGERLTEEHGRRDELRLDEITVTGERYTGVEGWRWYE